MSHTWKFGDTHFIGNADMSGDLKIVRGDDRITVPACDVLGFANHLFQQAIDDAFSIHESWQGIADE